MRDRFITRFAIALFTSCIVNADAYCFCVDSFLGMGNLYLDENLVVTDTGNFYSPRVDVVGSVSIANTGVINSDFYLADATRVYVRNSGEINGVFHVSPNSHLFQVVQSMDDVTYINADTNFSVLVYDAENIAFNDVMTIAFNADKIILADSTLVLNSAERGRSVAASHSIEIIGDVVLKLNSVDGLNFSTPVLRNISGDGRVRVDISGMSSLYKIATNITDGDLYLNLVRETDYVRIFQNDVGKFLGDLRNALPNDKLLRAMDDAPDIDALNSVMSYSVRLHPVKLMFPVLRMHMLDALDGWRYGDTFGIHSAADVIFSDTASLYRANISTVGSVARNLYAAFGGYIAGFNVTDDINDFSGRVLGTNLNLHFDDGVIIGNMSGGIASTNFDVGPVFDGHGSVNNPNGISGFVALDIGANLLRISDLTIVPFAGAIANYASVLDDTITDAVANIGMDVNLSEYGFDILYDYGGRVNVLSDGTLHVGAFVKFDAPDDDVGGELNVVLIHDEYGTGYKISVSAHVLF